MLQQVNMLQQVTCCTNNSAQHPAVAACRSTDHVLQAPTFSAVSVAAHTAVASPPRRGATLYLHFFPLASSKACTGRRGSLPNRFRDHLTKCL